jgi:hypothetical protein
MEGRERLDLQRGEEKGKKKRNGGFSNPAYIHRLTDEYRWARIIKHVPSIFISEVTPLTNIGHVYSSVTWLHRGIYGADQSQTRRPIYSLVPELNRRI